MNSSDHALVKLWNLIAFQSYLFDFQSIIRIKFVQLNILPGIQIEFDEE